MAKKTTRMPWVIPTPKPLSKPVRPEPLAQPTKRRVVYEDAVTGQFVTPKYAADHPDTTIKRHLPVEPPKKSS
jgi:hypothetical protein